MAYSKLFVVVVFSWFFVGLSHGIDLDKTLMGAFLAGGVDGGISAMSCVEKLITCQPALASHMKNPPPSCCAPLKEMITNDTQCLCAVFNNTILMNTLNVTEDEAINFAKSCGANPDLSLCKNAAASPGSASTPSVPTEANSSSSSNKTASPPAKSTSSVTSQFGGFVAVASFMSLVLMLLAF
ncbi:hypothetical protein HAX54_024343 [Datura stramonium]|uniref:Bifunctional inhibitor/plant lipid transfer protein/seed storage helical domain-containing protein n=1 Tax=Datura stramonium TaxID=4076 RepID=A0ABS8S7C0_DATST|nr:hypothetical protein [Datura stramonium]